LREGREERRGVTYRGLEILVVKVSVKVEVEVEVFFGRRREIGETVRVAEAEAVNMFLCIY
jgi:hypothetical protein